MGLSSVTPSSSSSSSSSSHGGGSKFTCSWPEIMASVVNLTATLIITKALTQTRDPPPPNRSPTKHLTPAAPPTLSSPFILPSSLRAHLTLLPPA
ncbi:hypothetical protein E2C01_086444 [Portunus trituberculatus]|uniref:Uncharacterized protein n=1 Tax=Portunus trituberculatus TaxID=210409 RepID=A0A5B7J9A7_PORTR|nr:hypothetical protein [Portunus trituberculatus]